MHTRITKVGIGCFFWIFGIFAPLSDTTIVLLASPIFLFFGWVGGC